MHKRPIWWSPLLSILTGPLLIWSKKEMNKVDQHEMKSIEFERTERLGESHFGPVFFESWSCVICSTLLYLATSSWKSLLYDEWQVVCGVVWARKPGDVTVWTVERLRDERWHKFWIILLQEWTDINLAWNKSEYDGIGDIRIPPR